MLKISNYLMSFLVGLRHVTLNSSLLQFVATELIFKAEPVWLHI